MKTNLLLTLLAVFYYFITYSQTHSPDDFEREYKSSSLQTKSLIPLYDSIYFWDWDTLTTGWMPVRKSVDYVYNSNNYKTAYLEKQWNGNSWQNYFNYSYTYDSNNNLTNYILLVWNNTNSTWENSWQETYTYDANNNKITKLFQNGNGNTWIYGGYYTLTYDANNNLLTEVRQINNGTNWVNSTQYVYTYDTDNNQTGYTYQNWNGSAWVNSNLITCTYNTDAILTEALYQSWVSNAWVNSSDETFTYDGNNNMTVRLRKVWSNNAWVNNAHWDYIYDVNNNIITTVMLLWNSGAWINNGKYEAAYNGSNMQLNRFYYQWINNSWEIKERIFSTYDANDFQITYSQKALENQGSFVTSGDSTHYYFHTIQPPCSASFTLYPDTTLQHNWFLIANATGIQPLTYYWEWGDGATSTGSNPSHTYSVPGNYNICLTITDANNCSSTYCDSSTYIYKTEDMISVNVVNQLPNGIEETGNDFVNIYPNPASSSIVINGQWTMNNGQLKIMNTQGQLVYQCAMCNEQLTIDVRALSSGIYFLSLTDGEKTVNRKFVKE